MQWCCYGYNTKSLSLLDIFNDIVTHGFSHNALSFIVIGSKSLCLVCKFKL